MRVSVHRSRFGSEYWLHYGHQKASVIYRYVGPFWERREGLGEPWEAIPITEVPDEVLVKHDTRVEGGAA